MRVADSRVASNLLLAELRHSNWSAPGVLRFLRSSFARSLYQAATRPRAVVEATSLHLLIAALSPAKSRSWVFCSFFLTMTHLGMLGEKRRLGLPNMITLVRANLPVFDSRLGPAIPLIALVSDFLDGKLARASASVTAFGTHADFFSDTAVWTWFTLRKEPSTVVRSAVFAAWLIPILAMTALSVGRGRIIDLPRSRWVRPSAAVEIIIGGRAVLRLLRAGFGRCVSDGVLGRGRVRPRQGEAAPVPPPAAQHSSAARRR